MNHVVIALGSNIDKERNIRRAVRILAEQCRIAAVSSIYETEPVGLLHQPNFLNAAVAIETELDAAQLKSRVLGSVETRLKRVRTDDKNAPRTIDADIVLFNDEVFSYAGPDSEPRQVPDPDLLKFPHVAVPVAELAPNQPHPLTGESLKTIADRLLQAAVERHGRSPIWVRPDIQLPHA